MYQIINESITSLERIWELNSSLDHGPAPTNSFYPQQKTTTTNLIWLGQKWKIFRIGTFDIYGPFFKWIKGIFEYFEVISFLKYKY